MLVVCSSLELPYTIKRNVENTSANHGSRPPKKAFSPPPSVTASLSSAVSGQRKKPAKGKTSGMGLAQTANVSCRAVRFFPIFVDCLLSFLIFSMFFCSLMLLAAWLCFETYQFCI